MTARPASRNGRCDSYPRATWTVIGCCKPSAYRLCVCVQLVLGELEMLELTQGELEEEDGIESRRRRCLRSARPGPSRIATHAVITDASLRGRAGARVAVLEDDVASHVARSSSVCVWSVYMILALCPMVRLAKSAHTGVGSSA